MPIRKIAVLFPVVMISSLTWLLFLAPAPTPLLAQGPDGPEASNELLYNEQQLVHLTNLKRAAHGLPPLRWNRQLTEAARWFSWDSVANRPGVYCGHDDTRGGAPWDRAWLFEYYGFANAENAFCSYILPEQAVEGWYNETPPDDGHRQNLLNPISREVGVGYYRSWSDGRGYITQDFGNDSTYPPVIINHEAIQTTDPAVNLYIHSNDSNSGGGITSLGPATEMMIANDPCFSEAAWEPYNPTRSWRLEPGAGWRTVYAKIRDAGGRSLIASDTIYLGPSIPYAELDLSQAAARSDQVTMYELDNSPLPLMQFSGGWVVELEKGTLWGPGHGEVVADPEASAGQAYRLRPGAGVSQMWVTPTDYPRGLASQAYFRLKVADNSNPAVVAQIAVSTNGMERDRLRLKGTDFAQAGVYQEFPLDFIQEDGDDPFLILSVKRQSQATLHVDRAALFTAPEPVQETKTWETPGRNYRGQTVWVRYTDNQGTFSPITEARTIYSRLEVSSSKLNFLADGSASPSISRTLTVGYGTGCRRPPWTVQSSASWLRATGDPPHIYLSIDPTTLSMGHYSATLTIDAGPDIAGSPQLIPVTFYYGPLKQVFLPHLQK